MDSETRENIKVIVSIVQAAGIVFTALWAAYTFKTQSETQLDNARRDLRRPYDVKQLELYTEAAQVVARLATSPPGVERTKAEGRFWELYWGELAFVESQAIKDGPKSVETLMVTFCESFFTPAQCHGGPDGNLRAAINLAHQASDEIRRNWNVELGLEQ